jgi:hypothetical protein
MRTFGGCDSLCGKVFKEGDTVTRLAGPWSKTIYNLQYCDKCQDKKAEKFDYENATLKKEDEVYFSLWNYIRMMFKHSEIINLEKGPTEEKIKYFKEKGSVELINNLIYFKMITVEAAEECVNYVKKEEKKE